MQTPHPPTEREGEKKEKKTKTRDVTDVPSGATTMDTGRDMHASLERNRLLATGLTVCAEGFLVNNEQ